MALTTTTWGEWKGAFPNTEVLSIETGFVRNYNQYPYGTYEENDELIFGIENLDQSLQIKTPVLGVELANASKAYPVSVFETEPVIEDQIGEIPVRLELEDSGNVRVTNAETGEELVAIRLFWFAWASFHPGTELYKP